MGSWWGVKVRSHHRGDLPYSFRTVVWVLYVPSISLMKEGWRRQGQRFTCYVTTQWRDHLNWDRLSNYSRYDLNSFLKTLVVGPAIACSRLRDSGKSEQSFKNKKTRGSWGETAYFSRRHRPLCQVARVLFSLCSFNTSPLYYLRAWHRLVLQGLELGDLPLSRPAGALPTGLTGRPGLLRLPPIAPWII